MHSRQAVAPSGRIPPNLYLAADYVRTSINLATMEGGNEAGRMAANAVLADSGSSAPPALPVPDPQVAVRHGAGLSGRAGTAPALRDGPMTKGV
ncbi:MAG TPA: hypothetical protein VFV66_02355 [Nonomuraea sp.]|nr:hypothetical protein [Nonomuraea sp.]